MAQGTLDEKTYAAVELAERVLAGEPVAEPGARPCAEQYRVAVMDWPFNFC
ncbi:hypothetical protein ACIQF6_01370 [Kitasatospora sp. NPDC092948]|uniref:hypothetical protein n=1 Tax=Kitasatospora sp. NPDC092948 TaxID=3364088 RepID=UPI0038072FB0